MKKLLLIVIIALSSCENKPPKKPFVIITKYSDGFYRDGTACYNYQDANGKTRDFVDGINLYKIGDTIK